MSYKYLQDKSYYENLYDTQTVSLCRVGEKTINKIFSEMEKKVPVAELKERRAGWYLWYSLLYFQLVESLAVQRYQGRENSLLEKARGDQEKDDSLDAASPHKNYFCLGCGKDMVLVSKEYMSRKKPGSGEYSDKDEILFMLECKHCNIREAYWEDGTEWEGSKTSCAKCGSQMRRHEKEEKPNIFTTAYSCPDCCYEFSETVDLNISKERKVEADPYLELDKKRFCIDESTKSKILQKASHLERLTNLYTKEVDRVENADIYEAIKDVKKLTINQLAEILSSQVEKAGYNGFKLGDPEIGKDVIVTFSCLDAKPERKEYDSKTELKKLIQKELTSTNWRLMSDGVSYRLGYLSGRLRAYENEEDIRKLVEQQLGNEGAKVAHPQFEFKEPKFEGMALREAALVYTQNLTLAQEKVENGTNIPDKLVILAGELNDGLRVVIPAKKDEESVPKFVREFDFKMVSKSVHLDWRNKRKLEKAKKLKEDDESKA